MWYMNVQHSEPIVTYKTATTDTALICVRTVNLLQRDFYNSLM